MNLSEVKRSKSIRLVLIGGLSSVALTGCDQKPAVSTQNYYTNNFYVPGAGYYHAPFRNWYPLPYNHFDVSRQMYFYGGQWSAQPGVNITNISSPTPESVNLAQAQRTDVQRGGFGHSYGGYSSGRSSWGFHS